MQVPDKMHDGDSPLKIKKLWNDLIDYLRADRLTAGSGVSLRRLPSGTIISAAGEKAAAPARESAGGGYSGYFKVITDPSDSTKIKIIDGSDPAAASCGKTDIGDVPTASISGASKDFDIYLNAQKAYPSCNFTFTTVPDTAYWLIATVRDGVIYQQWQSGMIFFSSRYMI